MQFKCKIMLGGTWQSFDQVQMKFHECNYARSALEQDARLKLAPIFALCY